MPNYDTVPVTISDISQPTGQRYEPIPVTFAGKNRPPVVLAQSAIPSSVTGTTNETVLATIPIPAGTIGPNGALRLSTLWTGTNSANGKVTRARLGAAAAWGINLTTQATEYGQFVLMNRNSQSSQIATSTVGPGASASAFVLTSVDTSADIVLSLTATLSSAAETVTLEGYLLELIKS